MGNILARGPARSSPPFSMAAFALFPGQSFFNGPSWRIREWAGECVVAPHYALDPACCPAALVFPDATGCPVGTLFNRSAFVEMAWEGAPRAGLGNARNTHHLAAPAVHVYDGIQSHSSYCPQNV